MKFKILTTFAVILSSSSSMASQQIPESTDEARGRGLLRAAAVGGGNVEAVHSALQEPITGESKANTTRKAPCYPEILTHDQLSKMLLPNSEEMIFSPGGVVKIKMPILIEGKNVTVFCSTKSSIAMEDNLVLELRRANRDKKKRRLVGILNETILAQREAHTMATKELDAAAVVSYNIYSYPIQNTETGIVTKDDPQLIFQMFKQDFELKKDVFAVNKFTPLSDFPHPIYIAFAASAEALPDMPVVEDKRKSDSSGVTVAAALALKDAKASDPKEKQIAKGSKKEKEKKGKDNKDKTKKS